MRTVQIPADRLTTRHRIVEHYVGPRGGRGSLVAVPISEVQVSGERVTVRVRVDGDSVQRVYGAADPIRVEGKTQPDRPRRDEFQQAMSMVMEVAGS